MSESVPRKSRRWRKILSAGRFNLFQGMDVATIFEVSWKKAGGRYGRRRFAADNVERAIDRAPIVAGLEQDVPDPSDITIIQGFSQALDSTKRGDGARRDWIYQQTLFIEWLSRNYPKVAYWRQVTRKIVTDYKAALGENAPNTVRLYFQPITQTARYLEHEYQLPNVAAGLGLSAQTVRATPSVFLVDVLDLLDFLRDQYPEFEAGAALQGLAALRLQETLRLTWGKVDLERGLIEIGSPGQDRRPKKKESERAKTDWSHRTIPVSARVVEALRRAWERRPNPEVQDLMAQVIPSPDGESYMVSGTSWRNYTKDFREAMLSWNPQCCWQVKDLRNALPTAFHMAKLASDASEEYMGHAPRGVTARHYVPRLSVTTKGEAKAFEDAMQHFRNMVVDPLERLMRQAAHPKILDIFERVEAEENAGETQSL